MLLVAPSHTSVTKKAAMADVMNWDNTAAAKVLEKYLGDDATWDEEQRKKLTQELQLAEVKIAECTEARNILLEVKDLDEAAVYQKELDRYVLLAADCQRRLLLWT